MQITRILTLVASLTAFLSANAGAVTEYITYCGPFDRLEVLDNVNVIYACNPDSAGYMRYTGEKRFADAFIVNNNKGKLKIQVNTEDVNDPALPDIYIYSNFLTSVSNSSLRKVEVLSIAPCPELSIKQIGNGTIGVDGVKCDKLSATIATGNGSIIVTGSTDAAAFKMVGTGTIQADLLRANTVKCRVVGSGTIGCWPLESLDVKGLGSTKVYYRGEPVVSKGPGLKVMQLDQMPADYNSVSTRENSSDIDSQNSSAFENSPQPQEYTEENPSDIEPAEEKESVEEEAESPTSPSIEPEPAFTRSRMRRNK